MENLELDLTIAKVLALKAEAANKINTILNEFEKESGTHILSVDFTQSSKRDLTFGNGVKITTTETPSSVTIKTIV
jgi:hypothetical protein